MDIATLPVLKKELPEHLSWLEERVRQLVRPVAFLRASKGTSALPGQTLLGVVDVPVGGASGFQAADPLRLCQSPYDGDSSWLQLDLESIPTELRAHLPKGLPAHGVVWMTLNLSGSWRADTYFDPRPRSEIQFRPRLAQLKYESVQMVLRETLPFADEQVLPEIAWDWKGGQGLCSDYDDWVQEHYGGRGEHVQLGGWVWPCQGFAEERQPSFVLGFERQAFGDSGSAYLHFTEESGFFGIVETH